MTEVIGMNDGHGQTFRKRQIKLDVEEQGAELDMMVKIQVTARSLAGSIPETPAPSVLAPFK